MKLLSTLDDFQAIALWQKTPSPSQDLKSHSGQASLFSVGASYGDGVLECSCSRSRFRENEATLLWFSKPTLNGLSLRVPSYRLAQSARTCVYLRRQRKSLFGKNRKEPVSHTRIAGCVEFFPHERPEILIVLFRPSCAQKRVIHSCKIVKSFRSSSFPMFFSTEATCCEELVFSSASHFRKTFIVSEEIQELSSSSLHSKVPTKSVRKLWKAF